MGSTIKKISKKKIRVIKTNSYSNKFSNKSNINKSCKKNKKKPIKNTITKKNSVHIGGFFGRKNKKNQQKEQEAKRQADEEEAAKLKAEEEAAKRKAEEEAKKIEDWKNDNIIDPLIKQNEEKKINKDDENYNIELDLSMYNTKYKKFNINITPYLNKKLEISRFKIYNISLLKFLLDDINFDVKVYTEYYQQSQNSNHVAPTLDDLKENINTTIKKVINSNTINIKSEEEIPTKENKNKNNIMPRYAGTIKTTLVDYNVDNPIFTEIDNLAKNKI